MVIRDNAEAIRNRAYEIWEREGRPSGREHEHWAEATREVEAAEQVSEVEVTRNGRETVYPLNLDATKEKEAERLRKALWEAPPHSVELFPGDEPEAPEIWDDRRRALGGRNAA